MEKIGVGFFQGKPISAGFVLSLIFFIYALYYISFATIDIYCPSLNKKNFDHVQKTSNNDSLVSFTSRSPSPSSKVVVDKKCEGKYIYVLEDLPPEFNRGLLDHCKSLSPWVDFCRALSNDGFGPKVNRSRSKSWSLSSWYVTNQFSLEVIFHARMKIYACRTDETSLADAIFVPFYAGLDIGRHLWGDFDNAVRDSSAERLGEWLVGRPEWRRFLGRDHFFVGGRVAWDFRRQIGGDWGSRLMLLPGPANMTMLTIETTTENPADSNEFAVPYPTFFHPSVATDVARWQRKMRRARRPSLFSFVGAPRNGTVRGEIFHQCKSSPKLCRVLRCDNPEIDCEEPVTVAKALSKSVFCLQPAGDSFTRRSMFESLVAGCVPVFFHRESAYEQYRWYFPDDPEKYSVYIPAAEVNKRKVSIGDFLRRIPKEKVSAMREEVIRMIPNVVYADPATAAKKGFNDAFDIAIENMILRVKSLKKELEPSL